MQNILVAVRVRPTSIPDSPQLLQINGNSILFDAGNGQREITSKRPKSLSYQFDSVFPSTSSQIQIYNGTIGIYLDSLLNGHHLTLFAYGATGCGKTHTLMGTSNDPGLIQLTMTDLYKKIDSMSVKMTLSFFEIYNETIRDLWSSKNCELRQDGENCVVVGGLTSKILNSLESVIRWINIGNERRIKAATGANATSSRSHAILQVHLEVISPQDGYNTQKLNSTLSIIDLAGSERASVTKNEGQRLIEGANINRSLLALGNCINALCTGKQSHVPFRDSKLTRLLQSAFTGNGKILIILSNMLIALRI